MKLLKSANLAPLALVMLSGFAIASCPGPRSAEWNPNEGTCVSGYLTNYCQDTELARDADCGGTYSTSSCAVAPMTTNKDKRIYVPYYGGQCGANNPCNFSNISGTIQYHYIFMVGFPGSC